MKKLSNPLGRNLVRLVPGVTRVTGFFYFFNYEALTLFIGGRGLMVLTCLAKLEVNPADPDRGKDLTIPINCLEPRRIWLRKALGLVAKSRPKD